MSDIFLELALLADKNNRFHSSGYPKVPPTLHMKITTIYRVLHM